MSLRVLFVDDQEVQLTLLRRVLRRHPVDIMDARSHAEALEVLRAREVDVVVTDLHLGESSGVELVRAVRQERPDVRTLLVSGSGPADLAAAAEACGASGWLARPFSTEQLLTALGLGPLG